MRCPDAGGGAVESVMSCSLPARAESVFNLPHLQIGESRVSPLLPGGSRTSLTCGRSQRAAEHRETAAAQPWAGSHHLHMVVHFRLIFFVSVVFLCCCWPRYPAQCSSVAVLLPRLSDATNRRRRCGGVGQGLSSALSLLSCCRRSCRCSAASPGTGWGFKAWAKLLSSSPCPVPDPPAALPFFWGEGRGTEDESELDLNFFCVFFFFKCEPDDIA